MRSVFWFITGGQKVTSLEGEGKMVSGPITICRALIKGMQKYWKIGEKTSQPGARKC
jgi:hypothetical protein